MMRQFYGPDKSETPEHGNTHFLSMMRQNLLTKHTHAKLILLGNPERNIGNTHFAKAAEPEMH